LQQSSRSFLLPGSCCGSAPPHAHPHLALGMSHSASRHYPNPATTGAGSASSKAAPSAEEKQKEAAIDDLVKRHLPGLLEAIQVDFPLRSQSAVSDADREDPTAYEGDAGIAWMFLQLDAAQLGSSYRKEALQYAVQAAKIYEAEQAGSRHPPRVTFYCGAGGIYSILTLAILVNGSSDGKAAIQQLLSLKNQVQSKELPDEILYGRAGYMHSLLLVQAHINKSGSSELKEALPALRSAIDETFDAIIARGCAFKDKSSRCPMMWSWHDSKYLGGAHGVTGILYMLLQCRWRFEASAAKSAELRSLVLSTLDYCLSIRLPSGNFPSSEKDSEPSDRLVQWCHGAPGLALACLQAHEVLGEKKYVQPAQELGEVIWERGLLRKGIGLCHGIGGNALVFLKLLAATGDAKYLCYASSFARFALESSHAAELAEQPDEPSSLGNGRAGFVCFLAEAMKLTAAKGKSAKQSSVCFPGMDLLE
jgi:hypothetical protein